MWAIDSQIKKYFCPFVWRLKGEEEGLLSGRLGGRTLLSSLSLFLGMKWLTNCIHHLAGVPRCVGSGMRQGSYSAW